MQDLTVTEAVWTALVALAIHRLWIYEDVFTPLRRKVTWKGLTCAPCFAYWAGVMALLLTAVHVYPGFNALWWSLGLYTIVRGVMVFYVAPVSEGAKKVFDLMMAKPAAPAPVQLPAPAPCGTCKSPVMSDKLAIIMTCFSDFAPAYSLVTCVMDQARALVRLGYQVQLWVNEGCDAKEYPISMPREVLIRKCMPLIPTREDIVDDIGQATALTFLQPEMNKLSPNVVITHDLVFQSWFVTWAAAIHELDYAPGTKWFHQVHSAPALPRTVTRGSEYRMTIPDGHNVLCVNYSDRVRFAEYYGIEQSRVLSVPNARDLRTWAHMERSTLTIVDTLKLDEADIVQVYGLSGTRMEDKGLSTVIDVFASLKNDFGFKVKLVVVDAHSALLPDPTKDRALISRTRCGEQATSLGLIVGEDVHFTSTAFPQWANGLPGPVTAELQLYGNVFVFPTISEAGSLVLMEAALSGAILVLNQDVPALADFIPHDQALWFHFGNGRGAAKKAVPVKVAEAIDAAYRTSKALRARRTIIQQHNLGAYANKLRAAIEGSSSL